MEQSRKSPGKKSRKKDPPLIETLPGLLTTAIDDCKDFILCFETDEETGKRNVHVMTGQFVSSCMLRKLIGVAESQKDEGATLKSRKWEPVKPG